VSPRIAECELTYLEREPIDARRAAAQHEQYERSLASHGCRLVHFDETSELPDGVFVEDAAIVLDEIAVITRPGAESRQPETASVARVLSTYRELERIVAPGTIDGGDVLHVDRTLYVGRWQRTNDAGIGQLAEIAGMHGYKVVPVDFRGCLHLKSAVTLIAPDTLLVNPDWVDPGLFNLQSIAVDPDEPSAANALRIGEVVLMAAEHPRTRQILERRGLSVDAIALGELLKAEAGVTCCSVIVWPPGITASSSHPKRA